MHEGFGRGSPGGPQAMRIPFAQFAGGGTDQSVLQLVLHAVSTTGDYSIFDRLPVKVLLQYKWQAFGFSMYTYQSISVAIDLAFAVAYNTSATEYTSSSCEQLAQEVPHFFVIASLGWSWTTAISLRRIAVNVPRLSRCRNFFKAGVEINVGGSDSSFIVIIALLQLVTNALAAYARTQPSAFDGPESAEPLWLPAQAMRFLHGVCIILGVLYVCFTSFRGFLKFGALVHMVLAVVQDICPFLILVGMVIMGYSVALSLVTADHDSTFGQYSFLGALGTTIDMGLYATTIDPDTMHSPSIFALYFPYMLTVQVILLNLLIAIITTSYYRVGNNAARVALYQRARLTVELEPRGSAEGGLHRWLGRATLSDNNHPRPRWLHVLLPAEEGHRAHDQGDHVQRRLSALEQTMTQRMDILTERLEFHAGTLVRDMEGLSTGLSVLTQAQRKIEEGQMKMRRRQMLMEDTSHGVVADSGHAKRRRKPPQKIYSTQPMSVGGCDVGGGSEKT